MANTRSAAKRVRQTTKRQTQNRLVRATTRTALTKAIQTIQKKDKENAADAYKKAVQALSKAASHGALPERRVARKISRLTLWAQKEFPEALASK